MPQPTQPLPGQRGGEREEHSGRGGAWHPLPHAAGKGAAAAPPELTMSTGCSAERQHHPSLLSPELAARGDDDDVDGPSCHVVDESVG